MEEHSNNNIRTYTGLRLDPFHIQPHEVRIEDIVHALSMMVRANGHLGSFYSVAQHCLGCAVEAENRRLSGRVQLACLLHDAAECYIADVPRPVKHRLIGYAEIEQRVLGAVFAAFGLSDISESELKEISGIDDAMLYYEFEALAGVQIKNNAPYISMRHDFSQKRFEEVEVEFIDKFKDLITILRLDYRPAVDVQHLA